MDNFWQHCLDRFKTEFDETSYNAFIRPTAFRIEDNKIILISPNTAIERWLRQHIYAPLQDSVNSYFKNSEGTPYQIIIQAIATGQLPEKIQTKIETYSSSIPPSPRREKPPLREETGLIRKQTFQNFVTGSDNELAYFYANQIASGESNISPLFIHGSTGLGKTHLLQAIGNDYLRKFPDRQVLYTLARKFMSDVVYAYRSNKVEQFKQRYRTLDVLIIDDIQYIGGDRKRTQEEFFFLFNDLHEEEKNIVISSDRSPLFLDNMPRRLSTRFNAGLMTEIKKPNFELRCDILQTKAELGGIKLKDEVIRFIAEHVKSNVRELEGALKRLHALAKFQGKTPTLSLCREAISDFIGQSNVIISADTIKEQVAKYYNIRVADLSSVKRHRSVARPRHIAIYLCRRLTDLSLPNIGSLFGGREHTTVMHSCRWVIGEMEKNNKLKEQINLLESLIKE